MLGILVNLIGYLLLLLAGSLFMCGWYKVTRKGMLLGFWSQFFEAIRDDVRDIQADIDHFKELKESALLAQKWEQAASYHDEMKRQEWMRDRLKEYGSWYKLPGYLVHPFSGCVYCYSSVYGSLFFWIAGTALARYGGYTTFFSWHVFVLWITYIVSCIALNGIIIKKVV